MMPDPTTPAPIQRPPHRTTLEDQPDVAAWYGLQAAETDCGEAEAALRAVDPADDPLGYAFAVAALAGARAATAHGWVAYASLIVDDAPPPACAHTHLYALTTARRCVLCDQPDTGALSCAGATS